MKKPLFAAVVASLCLIASPALPATPGPRASRPSTHTSKPHTHRTHLHSGGTHHARHPAASTIPRVSRHVTYQERKTLFERAGIPRSQWRNYIVDHRVPLELGGSNDLSNLQVQTREMAHRKDRVENYLAARVRRGEISLSDAQGEIQHWQTIDTRE